MGTPRPLADAVCGPGVFSLKTAALALPSPWPPALPVCSEPVLFLPCLSWDVCWVRGAPRCLQNGRMLFLPPNNFLFALC